MKNYSIKIYTIEGCDRCAFVKHQFEESGIEFKEIKCEDQPTDCDKLEGFVKCEYYPMVMIEIPGQVYIMYVTGDYSKLGKTIDLGGDVYSIGSYSKENMMMNIKKLLHLPY